MRNRYITLLCVLTLSSVVSWAEAASSLVLTSTPTSHTFGPEHELTIPLKLSKGEYAVLLMRELSIGASIWAENQHGEKLVGGQYLDLYKRRRLLVTHEQCGSCLLRISTWGREGVKGEIELSLEKLSEVTDSKRFAAEKHWQTGWNYAIGAKEGGYEKCLPHYLQAIDLWKEVGDTKELMNAYFWYLYSSEDIVVLPERKKYLDQMRVLALVEDDKYVLVRSESEFARILFLEGKFDDAEESCRSALSGSGAIFDQTLRHWVRGQISNMLGNIGIRQRSFENANENYLKALGEYEAINDIIWYAETLNDLGFSLRGQNKLELAATYHQRAHMLSSKGEGYGLHMRTLYFMGVVSALRGRFFYALELLKEAEEQAIKLQYPSWVASTKAAEARINMMLGRLDESLELYQETRRLYETVGNNTELSTLALNLGRLYSKLGDFEKAQIYFEKAKAEFGTITGDEYRLNVLRAEISSLIKQGQMEEAKVKQEALLKMVGKSTNQFTMGRNLTQLAEIYVALQDYGAALGAAQKAVALQSESGDDLFFTHSSYLAAKAANSLGKSRSQVLAFVDQAIAMIENVRMTMLNDDLRQQFFALQKSIYEFKISLFLGEKDFDEEKLLFGLKSAEAFKARTLYEVMLRKSDDRHLLPGAKAKRNKILSQLDSEISQQQGSDTKKTEHILNKTFDTFIGGQQEEKEILQALNFEELLAFKQDIPKKEAYLYFFAGEDISYMWFISQDRLKMVPLPGSEKLHQKVNALNTELSIIPGTVAKTNLWMDLHRQRQAVSDLLIEPIKEDLQQYEHITIIPDGPIHKVPFASLYNLTNDLLLLHSHTISYSVSLATDLWLQRKENKEYVEGRLLLVANPQGKVENMLASAHANIVRGDSLAALPYAEMEARAIEDVWQERGNTDALYGVAATKSALYDSALPKYEVMHFATHALVNWDYPTLSAISLADSGIEEATTNRDLTVQEISQWRINAELVVLSACATASGKETLGEGPMGLSRAFFEAGSKRVLASLWPVEDEASSYLMTSFYQALLQDKLSPVAALRHARLQVSQNAKWSHPYYWAGFVLFGNEGGWLDE